MPIATKLGRVVTYHKGLPPIKSHDPLITCSFEITWQTGNIISLLHIPTATKLGRMMTYSERLLFITLLNPLLTRSCNITWQINTIIFPLPQCLQPLKLTGWGLPMRGSYTWSHITLWQRDLVRSRDNLRPLYLFYVTN